MYKVFTEIQSYCLKVSGQAMVKTKNSDRVCLKTPCLSDVQRNQVTGMIEAGLSARDVGRFMILNHHIIVTQVRRHADTGSVSDRPHPGRERVTSRRTDRHIILTHLRDRFRPATKLPE